MLDLAKTMQSKLPKDYENSYYKIYFKLKKHGFKFEKEENFPYRIGLILRGI